MSVGYAVQPGSIIGAAVSAFVPIPGVGTVVGIVLNRLLAENRDDYNNARIMARVILDNHIRPMTAAVQRGDFDAAVAYLPGRNGYESLYIDSTLTYVPQAAPVWYAAGFGHAIAHENPEKFFYVADMVDGVWGDEMNVYTADYSDGD